MATATNIAQGKVVAIIGKIIAIAPDGTKSAASQVVLGFTSDVGTIWAVNNLPYGQRLEFAR